MVYSSGRVTVQRHKRKSTWGDAHQSRLGIRSTIEGSEQSRVGYDRHVQILLSDTTSSNTVQRHKAFSCQYSREVFGVEH